MKVLIGILVILSSLSSFASEVIIADCGDYTLKQGINKQYFAGISHTTNNYVLYDEHGNGEVLEIALNSEGAVLTSKYIPARIKIDATWGNFELSITPSDGEEIEAINCVKL